jgi:RND family efflux transporter MFP subunit
MSLPVFPDGLPPAVDTAGPVSRVTSSLGLPGLVVDQPASGTPPVRQRLTRKVGVSLTLLAALAGLFALGYVPKQQRQANLEAGVARTLAEPVSVSVVKPKVPSEERAFALPGSVQALERTSVYSRADGFVSRWLVDMGDRVEAGQLLAELDTPELDRQIDQARASLGESVASVAQAKATRDYSDATLKRYELLAPAGLVTQQELEQRKAQTNIDAASIRVFEAKQRAQAAELARLEQLKSFARVVSPFAGSVAQRNVERGTLVSGASLPLFEIVATDPVRVLVQIPQSRVRDVKSELPAAVQVREYPEAKFEGKVTRSSGTLDPTSRTMTVEVQVPNREGRLMPGMYASVRLELASSRRGLVLPATTLVTTNSGVSVGVVDADGKVRLVPVDIERDQGTEVELKGGLEGSEDVIGSPPPGLRDGQIVRVLRPTAAASP